MAGILAAGLSSASTFLSLVGFSASNDIFAHRTEDDARRLRGSRRAMLGIGVCALLLAWLVPQGRLFWITYFAGTLFASCWGPVAFMSVWSRRITEAGAFWGIVLGLLGNLATNLVGVLDLAELPAVLDPILVGAVLSYLTIEAVSWRGQVTEREHRRRLRLHELPESETDPARLHGTLRYAVALMVFGVVLTLLLVVFYVLPYRNALAGGGGGELAMSLGIGLMLVLTGALAWWGTWRSYARR